MSRGVLSVLIVEDAEDSRELYAFAFEAAGFRAVCAESVAGAMSAMREGSVDAVVTDYNLPDGDGLAMLDAAADEGLFRSHMPAVLCTACSEIRRTDARVVAIFRKPVDIAKLVSVVREAVAEAKDETKERDSEEEMAS